jgi:hypothetical protein
MAADDSNVNFHFFDNFLYTCNWKSYIRTSVYNNLGTRNTRPKKNAKNSNKNRLISNSIISMVIFEKLTTSWFFVFLVLCTKVKIYVCDVVSVCSIPGKLKSLLDRSENRTFGLLVQCSTRSNQLDWKIFRIIKKKVIKFRLVSD